MKNILRHSLELALSLLLTAAVSSCGQDPPGDDVAPSGVVQLALQVGPSVVINSADYAIVNPGNGFSSTGMIPVGKSADVPVPIAGLPIASGYQITVTANAADGITVCSGATGFDVKPGSRSTVIVHLVCREPPRTGSIGVAGTLNVCPLLDGLGASPDQVVIGGAALLTATAHDADSAPAPLSYAWSATAGTFNNRAVPSPTFTCTQAGIATITVKVFDGDADPSCADQLTINVNCKVAQ